MGWWIVKTLYIYVGTEWVLSGGGFSTSPFINQPFPPAKGPKAIMSMSLLFSYPAPVAESSGSQESSCGRVTSYTWFYIEACII